MPADRSECPLPAPAPIEISQVLLREVYREARTSYPRECCGWLSGHSNSSYVTTLRACVNAQESAEHPTQPKRGPGSAYVIAGADLLALSHALASPSPPYILYHSHPNGHADLSKTDREVATSPWNDGPLFPLQQLVVGIDRVRITESRLYAWHSPAQGFVEIQRFPGYDSIENR